MKNLMEKIRTINTGPAARSIGNNLQPGPWGHHQRIAATRPLRRKRSKATLIRPIKTYDQVIKNGSAPPNQVAQALYREGMCYLKLKDEASARMVLENWWRVNPAQTEIVEKGPGRFWMN